MRNASRLFALLMLLFVFSDIMAQPGLEQIREVRGKKVKEIRSLKDHKRDPNFKDVTVRGWDGVIWGSRTKPQKPPYEESAADQSEGARQSVYNKETRMSDPEKSVGFDGVGVTTVAPADPTIAVGPNHIIQAANASSGTHINIFSKTGELLLGDKYLDEFTGYGGLGDPILLYDQLANRFIMTEFVNSDETGGKEGLIMAVSTSGDPLGGWYIYFYQSVGNAFPDYPKFSVWPDGYYATSNDFTSSYIGSSIYAFDRASMLNGAEAADLRTFRFLTGSYTRYFTMCPVLLQGTTLPPAGTGGLFAYMNDNFGGATSDSVGIIELKVNWGIPGNGAYRTWSSIPVSSFNGAATCRFSRGACIPQPGTTKKLESLERRVMNQPIYRNFGTHQGIVMTHFVNVNNVSALRWYELRNTAADNAWTNTSSTWSVHQQSSYAPGDGIHRWMGSVAYNAAGDIALAYNVSNGTNVYPGLRFTGRKSTDPLNQMTTAETVLKAGTGSATGYSRYGDYNHLVADPSGTDFWFTAMYNTANPWSTWVASFTLGGGVTPPPPGCNDTYEANETAGAAKTISLNSSISAAIAAQADNDWFKVSTNNSPSTNIKVTLSDFANDLTVELYNSTGTTPLGTKTTLANGDEVIVLNTSSKKVTYTIKVFKTGTGVLDPAVCYSLQAQSSSTQFAPVSIGTTAPTAMEMTMMKGLKLFPNPVMNELQVEYEAPVQGDVTVSVTDITGRLRMQETFTSRAGGNLYRLNTSRLNNGMYIMQIMQNGNQVAKKFEVRK